MPAETHRRHDPPDRAEIERAVTDVVADVLADAGSGQAPVVSRGATLRDDLRLDDLDVVALVEEIERALGDRTIGFSLDDDELQDLRTVGDLFDIVLANLGAVDG